MTYVPLSIHGRSCEQIYLLLAAGSSENLKPDLVMETFLKYANISDDVRFFYHRLEMYADESGNGERKLIPLENLGEEICMNSKTDL